jgi:tricorn protease interacting factor F2/3
MNTAMGLDALHSSHPIDVKVNSPSEIREIFDAISYDKGGCVLRMLESFVTEKNFRAGLRAYLKKFSYKNAQGNDLWDEIGKAAKMPVRSMVNSWLKQTGFPLVDVQKQDSGIILSQKRFVLEQKGRQKGLWEIPATIIDNGKTTSKILRQKQQSIPVTSEQILVNPGRNGFYRVRYSQDFMYDLKEMISQKSISHIDRWAIQNDLFALCISGDGKTRDYLDFTSSYENEDDYLTQSNVSGNLYALYHRTLGEKYNPEIQQIAHQYLRKMFDVLRWDVQPGEPHTNALLRSFVIAALGKMNDDEILCEANNRFKQYLQKPDSLNPDIQDAVFSLAAWSGATSYAKLLHLYKTASSQEQKIRFLGALSSFKDPKLLQRTLDLSQSKLVRSQNMHIPIMRISSNPYGKKILWPWLKKNWKKLRVKVGVGSPLLNRIVSSISTVADSSMEGEIRRFFKKNPTPGTEMTLSQTLERIRIHSQFLKQLRAEFA